MKLVFFIFLNNRRGNNISLFSSFSFRLFDSSPFLKMTINEQFMTDTANKASRKAAPALMVSHPKTFYLKCSLGLVDLEDLVAGIYD